METTKNNEYENMEKEIIMTNINENEELNLSAYMEAKFSGAIRRTTISAIETKVIDNTKTTLAAAYENGIKILIPLDEMDVYLPFSARNSDEVEKEKAKIYALKRMIGATVPYIVTDVIKEKSEVVASRKAAMKLLKKRNPHKKGDLITGTIIDVNNVYAVVEFDGQIGTVGRKGTSYSRIYNLNEYYKIGSNEKFIVDELDSEKCLLDRKSLTKNAFDEYIIEKQFFCKGGQYIGTIKAIDSAKVFIELQKGLTILCHYPLSIGHFDASIDSKVLVQISSIKEEEKKLSGRILKQL